MIVSPHVRERAGAMVAGCLGLAIAIPLLIPMGGCGSFRSQADTRVITPRQLQSLKVVEWHLPTTPDSVAGLFSRFDPSTFHRVYAPYLACISLLVDSLNAGVPDSLRIDTVAIDHTFENIGQAALQGKAIYLSSSYFYLYDDTTVLRSVVFHEFGHIHYRMLTREQLGQLTQIWLALQNPSGFYLLSDGEYSHNSRFGGHPEDSPAELFASSYNLFLNNESSLTIRSWLLPPTQRESVKQLRRLIAEIAGLPLESE